MTTMPRRPRMTNGVLSVERGARRWRACVWLAAFALVACDDSANAPAPTQEASAHNAEILASASLFAAAPDRRWRLPDRLNEISGLTVTREGRLFAHGDEQAIIHEIDNDRGRLVRSFALGDPILRGDFEGIAATDEDDLYLITSTGRLYRFQQGGDGEHVRYDEFDTGLERVCEIEGLAFARATDSLIIACKTGYAPGMRNVLALYAWSVRTRQRTEQPWMTLPIGDVARAAGAPSFHPSSIDFDPRSGRLIMLAARDRALVELNADGSIAAGRRLDPSHRQAEGVAVAPDGALLIADEAAGAQAQLTRYPRAHD